MCLCACVAAAPTDLRHKVALVGKSTTSEFFLSVYAGAKAAATEYNIDLSIYSPDTEEDYQTQNRLVARRGGRRRRGAGLFRHRL